MQAQANNGINNYVGLPQGQPGPQAQDNQGGIQQAQNALTQGNLPENQAGFQNHTIGQLNSDPSPTSLSILISAAMAIMKYAVPILLVVGCAVAVSMAVSAAVPIAVPFLLLTGGAFLGIGGLLSYVQIHSYNLERETQMANLSNQLQKKEEELQKSKKELEELKKKGQTAEAQLSIERTNGRGH